MSVFRHLLLKEMYNSPNRVPFPNSLHPVVCIDESFHKSERHVHPFVYRIFFASIVPKRLLPTHHFSSVPAYSHASPASLPSRAAQNQLRVAHVKQPSTSPLFNRGFRNK